MQLFAKLLTSINHPIRFCLFVAACAVMLASCGGGGSGSTYWIGTKQLGVTGATTSGRSVATDDNGNVYVAGYTQCPSSNGLRQMG